MAITHRIGFDRNAEPGGKIYGEPLAEIEHHIERVGNGVYAPKSLVDEVNTRARRTEVYIPSSSAFRKGRSLIADVLAGARQGRMNCLGDSITFGAAETGNSSPKYASSWPGKLRDIIDHRFGAAGTGIVWANPDILANPAWDDRWTFAPSGVAAGTLGFDRDGSLTVTTGGYIDFTAECDEFIIYSLPGGSGHGLATVDGVDAGIFRNVSGAGSPTLPSAYAGKILVTPVPAGALGEHTLRVGLSGATTLHLIGIEAKVSGAGKWVVTNSGVSGKSFASGGWMSTNNDETNGFYGRPIQMDLPDGDLNLIVRGINDVQGDRPTADIKAAATVAVQRARSSGVNSQLVPHANGEAILVIVAPYTTAAAGYDAYREAFYQVADEQDCMLIDLSDRWGTFAQADALGMFADTIHPTDRGAADIAVSIYQALFGAI